jgi:propionate CoA-transferase
VFAGTFTADGDATCAEGCQLRIVAEGRTSKFVEAVEQITFNGPLAAAKGQSVLYVTERCVFKLQPEGLQLIEVAPGIDIERDVLSHMAFRPIIRDVALMDPRIYQSKPMGLAAALQDR